MPKNSVPKMDFPLGFSRQFAWSLDVDSVFSTRVEMDAYLSSNLRYAGQMVSCVEQNKCYVLSSALDQWLQISGQLLPASDDTLGGVKIGQGIHTNEQGEISISTGLIDKHNSIIYVDGNRQDEYTANGSLAYPFKTISEATAVAQSKDAIVVAPKTTPYTQDVILPGQVSLYGNGNWRTQITGTTTISAGGFVDIKGIRFNGDVTVDRSNLTATQCYFGGKLTSDDTGAADNKQIQLLLCYHSVNDSSAIQIKGNVSLISLYGRITNSGNYPAIYGNGGSLIALNLTQVFGNRQDALIQSTGAVINITNSTVVNQYSSGVGVAIGSTNSASVNNPNILSGNSVHGHINLGDSHTFYSGVRKTAVSNLTGTNIQFVKSDQIANTSTVQGATVTSALDSLKSIFETFESRFAVTKNIYVDGNRTDQYDEDGSLAYPYKDLPQAVAQATNNTTIFLTPGVDYTGDVVLPSGVSIQGYGSNRAKIVGDVEVGNTQTSLRYIQINGTLTLNGVCSLNDCYITGQVVTMGTYGGIQSWNSHFIGIENNPAIILNSNYESQITQASITTTGDTQTILINSGRLLLNTVKVSGSVQGAVLQNNGGTSIIVNSQVVNMTPQGVAIDFVDSDATPTNPNMLADVVCMGDVVAGTKDTVVQGLHFISGQIQGSKLIYRKASKIANNSSVQGVTVRDALNTLGNIKVDKVQGKGLSTQDFTTDLKQKLEQLESTKFKGYFASLADMQTNAQTGVGAYAYVDLGQGEDVVKYIWDTSDQKWVAQLGQTTAQTEQSIKIKYQSNPDTNAFTNDHKDKLQALVGSTQQAIVSTVSIGAIEAADTINAGTTVDDFIKMLLLKTYYPTYTGPSASLSVNLATNVQAGTTQTVNLTASFNRGSINGDMVAGVWNPSAKQNDRVGPVVNYVIDGQDNQLNNILSIQNYVVTDGANTWPLIVNYSQGPQPLDSLGNDYQSPAPAGTSNSSRTINGRRNAFYGTDSVNNVAYTTSEQIRNISGKTLNPSNGTSFSISIPQGTRMVTFAYPSSLRDVSSVLYVQGMNADVKSAFTQTTVSVEGANGYNPINYKLYTFVPAQSFSQAVTYNVTI